MLLLIESIRNALVVSEKPIFIVDRYNVKLSPEITPILFYTEIPESNNNFDLETSTVFAIILLENQLAFLLF